MKWYRVYAMVLPAVMSININQAQEVSVFPKAAYIVPYRLEVSYTKTTNLVFPAIIKNIDRGSEDVLVQKAEGVENILRVKAGSKNFTETNLTVVTSQGKLYSFIVNYVDSISYVNINVGSAALNKDPAIINSQTSMDEKNLSFYAGKAVEAGKNLARVKDKSDDMRLRMDGIYIKDNVFFCRFRLSNGSLIGYNPDQFRFTIHDKKQGKRTASQAVEIDPLYVEGETAVIAGKTKETWIVALPKFTIARGKYLAVEMTERNGGRNLALRVRQRHIMKAKLIGR